MCISRYAKRMCEIYEKWNRLKLTHGRSTYHFGEVMDSFAVLSHAGLSHHFGLSHLWLENLGKDHGYQVKALLAVGHHQVKA